MSPLFVAVLFQTSALIGVDVVDVDKGALLRGQTVLVEGRQITAVGAGLAVPAGATRIDGKGRFLIPGLVDAHAHLTAPEPFGACYVANGVTLVRDMGSATEAAVAMRAQFASGDFTGPEVVVTGAILDGPKPMWPFSEACGDAEQGRAAVRKVRRLGVDFVKVYSLLPKDAYTAILAECQAQGLRAVGHVPQSVSLLDTAAAGQLSVEHLTGFGVRIAELAGEPPAAADDTAAHLRAWTLLPKADPKGLADTLAAIARSGQYHCPTLVVMEGLARGAGPAAGEDPLLPYVPESMRTFWKSPRYRFGAAIPGILPHMKALVAQLHEAGVRLVVGTDLANPHVFPGFSVHREMAIWQELGIPAADILRSATLLPATLCGKADHLGSIAPGKTASFVLLRKDPLVDIRNAAEIEAVWLRGRHFDRKALDGLLAGARSDSAPTSQPTVTMDLPGKLVRRGAYRFTFAGNPAGSEEFVITETGSGYACKAWTKPQGGWQEPTVLVVHASKERLFSDATWEQLGKKPVSASYTRTTALEASATVNGRKLERQDTVLEPGDRILTPATCTDFFFLHALGLEEGGHWEGATVGFGQPTWAPNRTTDCRVERLPDGKVGDQPARHYASRWKTAMGALTIDVWTDLDGVVLKSTMKMPFGVVEAVLEAR